MTSAHSNRGWLRNLLAGGDRNTAQRAHERRQEMKAYWATRPQGHSHLEAWHSLATLEDEQAVTR